MIDTLFSFSEMVHRNSVPRNINMREEEMRNYIKQLISGSEQWRAMKLVVLGNGRIGKTTLLRAFDRILFPSSIHQVFYSPSFLSFTLSTTFRYHVVIFPFIGNYLFVFIYLTGTLNDQEYHWSRLSHPRSCKWRSYSLGLCRTARVHCDSSVLSFS